ncbi:MAG: hypothetical protein H7X80_11620 [bacterium]|nr:hypothetical protein [Candidatus Kapabacteria bacterium]
MKYTIGLMLGMLACVVSSENAFAQRSLRAAAYLINGTAVVGTINSVDENTIAIRTDRGPRMVPLDSVRSLEIIERSRFDAGPLAMVGGLYIGALVAGKTNDPSSGNFMPAPGDDADIVVFSAMSGAVIGGILAAFIQRREMDMVTEYNPSDFRARADVVEHVARGAKYSPLWTFTMHAANIYGSTKSTQAQALIDGGYKSYYSNDEPTDLRTRISSFALARRVELSRMNNE